MSNVKAQISNLEYPKIILASGSIWRKRLLKKHGIAARIHVTDFKEKKNGLSPHRLVLYNATGKARMAAENHPDSLVLGVDTLGVLGKKIICKPRDRADAGRILMQLSGKRHRVITGLCLIHVKQGVMKRAHVSTVVIFKKITTQELNKYLDSRQWKGKAGAYAIQGRAKGFVEKIVGDLTNVIGLPIETLKKLLMNL